MIIFPAIDILSGAAVRLYKGEYSSAKTYYSDPISVVESFSSLGAEALHVVDLDGAKSGETVNAETIKRIVKAFSGFVEVGGGIRKIDDIEKYLSCGVDRVILGSSSLDLDFLALAIYKFGERICVGLDLLEGCIKTHGWLNDTKLDGIEILLKMEKIGVKSAIVTDISRDGTLTNPSYELYRKISSVSKMKITASGGITTISDVVQLKEMSIWGAIIGKAYYEGRIDLKKAIEEANDYKENNTLS